MAANDEIQSLQKMTLGKKDQSPKPRLDSSWIPWSFAVNIVVLLIKQPLRTKHTSTVYKQGNLQENAQETFGSFVARSAVWLFLLILSLIGKPAPLASAAHSFKKPFWIPSGSICLPFGFHTACQEPHHLHPGLA